MKKYKTEQEIFWAGQFGDEYIKRNDNETLIASNIAMFSKILDGINNVESVIEFGANIGLNLIALKSLLPKIELSAIEINQKAVSELRQLVEKINIYHKSILDFMPEYKRDFVLIKGVLIHLDPSCLQDVYDKLYQTSNRYICIVEYYNPVPVEVSYRGHQGKLFKRDFSGEMLDKFKDLRLIRYGFVYHRDPSFPQDDITWFLLEKK
ncbi:MAG: pseudaminic acid biosynthesis-associated methylase [Desulfosporosinus sp. BRH_c37]|nr:MAG: pseudaminic acid biosynthesis-associated methylase [Desulfosporosinus sp. BRH_c37]